MLTRYLAQVSSIQVGDGQPITYPQGDGVVNLDTGESNTWGVGGSVGMSAPQLHCEYS